jgi:hypothetical protein
VNHLRTLSLGKNAVTRRQLLRALGVSAAATPFIPALNGWAAPNATPPKRLLLLFTPDGTVPEKWLPTGTETAWNFPAGGSLEPMTKHKDDMIVFKDMARQTGGTGGAHEHAMGGIFTGNSIAGNQVMAASVDQIIAKGLPKGQTDFESLQFGVMSFFDKGSATAKAASVNSYMIASGPKARMPAEDDPYKMFDRIFGAGFKAPSAGGAAPAGPSPEMERIRAEKKSVLDFLTADITSVRGKVGKEDGSKIDAHLETVRDIERRLTGNTGGGAISAACMPGTKPGMINLSDNASLPALLPIMNKMVAAAFACDRTRVASLQYSRAFSNAVHTWVGAKETHHTLSHGTQNAPVLAAIQNFYAKHLSGLLDELKAVQEDGKPMLDNMLCVYVNELSLGWTHGVSPSPCWWAGKLGGTIKTGRFIDYAGKNDHNQMLLTVAHAMGVMAPKIGDLGMAGTLPNILS